MIEIKILKDKTARRIAVEAKGHAETAQGQSLLCAAISSQMLGYSKAVAAMGNKILDGIIRVQYGDGIVDVKLATAKDYKRVERYLTPVEAAIDAYAGSFPDSLRIERH